MIICLYCLCWLIINKPQANLYSGDTSTQGTLASWIEVPSVKSAPETTVMWSEPVKQKDWFLDLFFLLYSFYLVIHKYDHLSITSDLNSTTLSRRKDSIGKKIFITINQEITIKKIRHDFWDPSWKSQYYRWTVKRKKIIRITKVFLCYEIK